MSRKIHLIGIDWQNSFCKVVDAALQQKEHDGELCIPGAWEDGLRLASFINKFGSNLEDIHMTLDSHQRLHIAHPSWFKDSSGNHPDPMTTIRNENGKMIGTSMDGSSQNEYRCSIPSTTQWTLDYLSSLQQAGRYDHRIWPYHCLISTPGHNVIAPVREALFDWERDTNSVTNFVTKGSNPFTEHFSAVKAEVVHPQDITTDLNTNFINTVMESDEILLTGQALTHCLSWTTRDIANQFSSGNLGDKDEFIKKCVLLRDCTSPIPGLEFLGDDFINEMSTRGMKVTTTKDYLA